MLARVISKTNDAEISQTVLRRERLKHILYIAYHFPPYHGSSGQIRTLKFVRYLPENGYAPIVLTAHPRAYEKKDESLLVQIPPETIVHRAFALDTKRHLALRGAYFAFLAMPDRFAPWIPAAIGAGLRLIHKYKVNLIFSTYPIASAHLIGYALHRLAKLPWVAEFRDPMWDDYTQQTSWQLKARQAIEALACNCATRVIVTTDSMREFLGRLYPQKHPQQIITITNGFDESDFQKFPLSIKRPGAPIRMIHAGLLDPVDRNPVPFFQAIKQMLANSKISPRDIVVELMGSGYEEKYSRELKQRDLAGFIHLCPSVPYHEALKKMAAADILLLFQGQSCNNQIPAKAYEYLRIGRPILALTPSGSETARLIFSTHAGEVAPPDQPAAIAELLAQWVQHLRAGHALPAATTEVATGFSRRHQTALLAENFSQILQEDQK